MLLPFQSRVYDTPLTIPQARDRLRASVQPRRPFRHGPAQHPFEGTVEEDSFQIQRTIRARNSFLPQLHGRMETTPSGRARVVVAFRIQPAVAVFMAVWFGFLVYAGASTLGDATIAAGDFDPRLIIGGMLAFGVVLVFGGFVPEAHKASRLLEELFDAGPAPERSSG